MCVEEVVFRLARYAVAMQIREATPEIRGVTADDGRSDLILFGTHR
jgi:hypothetical protein